MSDYYREEYYKIEKLYRESLEEIERLRLELKNIKSSHTILQGALDDYEG